MNATEEQVVKALRTVFDPEIPVNIYDLGLIYELSVSEAGEAHVKMTLTAPSCPVAGILPGQVEEKVRSVPGVREVKLDLVWDPPWNREMMSDAAKLELGFDLGFDTVPAMRLQK
jgi:FeS assembly SUF system protein